MADQSKSPAEAMERLVAMIEEKDRTPAKKRNLELLRSLLFLLFFAGLMVTSNYYEALGTWLTLSLFGNIAALYFPLHCLTYKLERR